VLVERAIGHLANAWALRRWRGLPDRVRDIYRATGALIARTDGSTGSRHKAASRTLLMRMGEVVVPLLVMAGFGVAFTAMAAARFWLDDAKAHYG
jgi:hypothetical protein